jgi:hypothetical protein
MRQAEAEEANQQQGQAGLALAAMAHLMAAHRGTERLIVVQVVVVATTLLADPADPALLLLRHQASILQLFLAASRKHLQHRAAIQHIQ